MQTWRSKKLGGRYTQSIWFFTIGAAFLHANSCTGERLASGFLELEKSLVRLCFMIGILCEANTKRTFFVNFCR
ncbi:MAG: hypothetical protein L0L37_03605, partial [Lacticaseibacillus paracasei]|nr:hypothetical protein [Lacticaseibacillus paracasei]